jgi:acyl-CoA synthetase (NDP forming)
VRAEDVEEMLDAAAYFSVGRLPPGRRTLIVTPSGGAGTWLADACAARGLELPSPEEAIQTEIASFLPPYGATANPVDITAGVALQGGLDRSLELLVGSERFDAIIIVSTLAALEYLRPAPPDLRRIADSTGKALVYYSYTSPRAEAIEALREIGIPCYGTPVRTARALAWAAWYRGFLDGWRDVRVLGAEGRMPADARTPTLPDRRFTEVEARAFLAPCGIPSPAEGLARSADEAVALLRSLGRPVALKLQSPDLTHKSDVGGVRLGLASEAAVREAYAAIMAAVAERSPTAEVRGVLVQRMVEDGVEVILGARVDPDFGPLVLVGLGGVFVEVFRDVALRLAPVSGAEARAMVESLRGAPLLRGARGRPPADLAALTGAIVRFSELAADLPPEVAAVEINPLLVRPAGQAIMMVDARVERT